MRMSKPILEIHVENIHVHTAQVQVYDHTTPMHCGKPIVLLRKAQ